MPLEPHPTPCPCGRRDVRGCALDFDHCCGPCIEDRTPAADAEALMRSRYSAYVRENANYLLATWHPSTRPSRISFEPGLRWLALEVKSHRLTGEGQAEVEFVARARPRSGAAQRLHENSRFQRESGLWFYVDGDHR